MSKYRAKKTVLDGIKFDSKKEAFRYQELKLLERAGEIEVLILQPRFMLQDGFKYKGKKIQAIYYIADFMYTDCRSGNVVVEDVKGMKTQVYNLKKKMFLKQYGSEYDFREV